MTVESRIDCADQTHRLVWSDGVLTTPDHADPDGERTLAALGGEGPRCIEILDLWQRHADDLDVLLLASRGPVDPVGPLDPPAVGYRARNQTGAYASRRTVRAATRAVGWTSFTPFGPHPGLHQPQADGLTQLLALPDGLPHCLVTTVVGTWAERLEHGDDRVPAALPALHAALYGRVAAAVAGWLDRPDLDLHVHLGDPPSAGRHDGALHVTVPFSWLRDVWAPGLAVVAGRFALGVTRPSSDRLVLTTVDRAFGPTRTVTVDVD